MSPRTCFPCSFDDVFVSSTLTRVGKCRISFERSEPAAQNRKRSPSFVHWARGR